MKAFVKLFSKCRILQVTVCSVSHVKVYKALYLPEMITIGSTEFAFLIGKWIALCLKLELG